jgi:hypothetical protein
MLKLLAVTPKSMNVVAKALLDAIEADHPGQGLREKVGQKAVVERMKRLGQYTSVSAGYRLVAEEMKAAGVTEKELRALKGAKFEVRTMKQLEMINAQKEAEAALKRDKEDETRRASLQLAQVVGKKKPEGTQDATKKK